MMRNEKGPEQGARRGRASYGRRRFRIRWDGALLVCVCFLGLAVCYALDVPLCPARQVFGVPCPGCGLTRASVALATLDFERAFAMHPLAALLLPLVGWALGGMLFERLPATIEQLPKWVWTALAGLVLGVWGIRLAGGLGGPPDPVDPAGGVLGRLLFLVPG